jgi:hypothetical protein
LLHALGCDCLDGGGDLHENGEQAKRGTAVFNACDVVYSTSEEASTDVASGPKAAERNTRARAWRGAGDQS